MPERKRRLSDMKEGEDFKPLSFKITPEVAGFDCVAADDRHPWFTKGSPFGGRILPTIDTKFCAVRCAVNHRDGSPTGGVFETPGLVHVQYDAEYFEPTRVGETVKITGKCSRRYEKRERDYMDFEFEIHGEDGRLITLYRETMLLPMKEDK